MDQFEVEYRFGVGGGRCPCCNGCIKNRKRLHRNARARMKRKLIKEMWQSGL